MQKHRVPSFFYTGRDRDEKVLMNDTHLEVHNNDTRLEVHHNS